MPTALNAVTSAAAGTRSSTAPSTAITSASQQLSTDAFLTLLSAQLQNQDPLEPMSTQDMLAQLTDLTTLNELSSLNSHMEAQARGTAGEMAALLGRTVSWIDPNSSDIVSGVVDRITRENGEWICCVGNQETPVDSLISIQ
ncbi:MAG: flagellar hook capping protein [Armatimonadetes bacterium]|jgi:flagellar basal-body rod modification protein FlgD|nr:flagellar hook capping protein [Armatimonadota bacterium]MDI9584322.1 flagellar hook capping FlgD N-terminal domain-containing protein [Acidobacteriota bacterium]